MTACIIWHGAVWSQGRYGMDKINGKNTTAHRAAWIRARGAIPDGLVVCHTCDNGLCVNIEHLFIGTMKDNMRDCIKKGRFKYLNTNQKGQSNNRALPDLVNRYKGAKEDRKNGMTWQAIKKKYSIKSSGHLRQILLSNY